jgi:sorbitol-specific phosphotransferase system component IIA
MIYDDTEDKLLPTKDDGSPKKLVDLSIIKKGHNFTSKAKRED